MAEIEGIDRLTRRLRGMTTRGRKGPTVVVGFAQPYAIYVHENMEAAHKEGKIAKYLEKPLRENRQQLQQVIRYTYQQTKDMNKSLMTAGMLLQRLAQEVVPVDTGALRASAYVALEQDAEQAAAKAYYSSEVLRRKVLKKRK